MLLAVGQDRCLALATSMATDEHYACLSLTASLTGEQTHNLIATNVQL